jgi:hypothetical protein
MRLITLLITVVALAVAAPAIADKGGTPHGGTGGGGGGGGDTPTATATPTATPDTTTSTSNGKKGDAPDPSITIASVNGARMAASTNPQPAHGEAVTFDTVAGSLAGWEYPMVALHCYQNDVLVYVLLSQPADTFTVGGGSSQWTAGDATCNASLYAYGWKGGRESIRELARTYDWTAVW